MGHRMSRENMCFVRPFFGHRDSNSQPFKRHFRGPTTKASSTQNNIEKEPEKQQFIVETNIIYKHYGSGSMLCFLKAYN